MAQVPNYYYNSPWIAQAANSLASALKPPDPQELLERDRAQWQFNRMQQLAQQQDEARATDLEADKALSELFLDEDAVNPVTGKVDEVQTGINRRNIAARVLKGGREYVDPVDDLLGPYSPSFETKQILAAVRAAATEAAIDRRFGHQQILQGANQDRLDARQANLFGHQWTMANFKASERFQLQNAAFQARMAEIHARIKGSNGDPTKVSGKALEDLQVLLEQKIIDSGATGMAPGAKFQLLTNMAVNLSKSGNVPLAVQQEWTLAGLPEVGEMPADEPGIVTRLMRAVTGEKPPSYLTPKFGGTGAETKLGGVVAPEGMTQAEYDIKLNQGYNPNAQFVPPTSIPPYPGTTPPPGQASAPAEGQEPPKPATPPPKKTPPKPAATPPKPQVTGNYTGAYGAVGGKRYPKPKSPEDFAQLKEMHGATFIHPDGSLRTVP